MASVYDTYFARSQKPKPDPVAYQPPGDMAPAGSADSPDPGAPYSDQADTSPIPEGGGKGVYDPAAGVYTNPNDAPPGDSGGGALLGPNGEWQPGNGELGPPVEPIDVPPPVEKVPTGPTNQNPTPTPTGGVPPNGDLGPLIAGKLSELFGRSTTPDAKDAGLMGVINASRHAGQRNLDRERALLAERASVEGTSDSGGFDTQLLGLNQDQGAKDQALESSLTADAGKQRIQEIMQALQLASGNQNANNNLGLSYAQLVALLNSQGLSGLLNGSGA